MALEVLLCVLIAWPIPGPFVLFQHQTPVRPFIFWNIVFRWLTPNFFIFLAQTVAEIVQRPCSFLCSFLLCCRCFYQAMFSSFFSSEERKGGGGVWGTVMFSGVLNVFGPCKVMPCISFLGNLWDAGTDWGPPSLQKVGSWLFVLNRAFAISGSFEAAIKPSSLCLILQILILEICHDNIKTVTRFSFFFSWSEVFISVFRDTSVCARPWV